MGDLNPTPIPNILKIIGHHRPEEKKLYINVQSLGYTPLKEGYEACKLGHRQLVPYPANNIYKL